MKTDKKITWPSNIVNKYDIPKLPLSRIYYGGIMVFSTALRGQRYTFPVTWKNLNRYFRSVCIIFYMWIWIYFA